jgi:DNA-binding MarR family transcriptional regulator
VFDAVRPGAAAPGDLAVAAGKGHVQTGYVITRLHSLLRRTMDDKLRALGLNTAHYVVLLELGDGSALSAAELARRAYVRPQAIAPLISALEDHGLIERAPHRQDRRIREVRMTPAGYEMLAKCGQRCESVEEQMLAGFAADDRSRLHETLLVCLTNMDPPWYERDGDAD